MVRYLIYYLYLLLLPIFQPETALLSDLGANLLNFIIFPFVNDWFGHSDGSSFKN